MSQSNNPNSLSDSSDRTTYIITFVLIVLVIFPVCVTAFMYVISFPLILADVGLAKLGFSSTVVRYVNLGISVVGAVIGAGYVSFLLLRSQS